MTLKQSPQPGTGKNRVAKRTCVKEHICKPTCNSSQDNESGTSQRCRATIWSRVTWNEKCSVTHDSYPEGLISLHSPLVSHQFWAKSIKKPGSTAEGRGHARTGARHVQLAFSGPFHWTKGRPGVHAARGSASGGQMWCWKWKQKTRCWMARWKRTWANLLRSGEMLQELNWACNYIDCFS